MHSEGPAKTTSSRRRVLMSAAAAACAASVPGVARGSETAPKGRSGNPDRYGSQRGLRGALGANFNQDLARLDYGELSIARAHWVRGFFSVPDADRSDVAEQDSVRVLLDAHRRGYGTILSLKFPLGQDEMPAPDSARMSLWLARVEKVLPAVMGRIDVLEVGNEPFIESREEDRGQALNLFYETITRRVIKHRDQHQHGGVSTRIYMGALNRLDLEENLTPAVERWMRFVRDTPQVDGVDIHPHVPDADRIPAFLDYILPRLRSDQKFLVTEFSLVWRWQKHLTDHVSKEFCSRFGYPSKTRVWQVIDDAINHPFSQRKWDAFLQSSSWFESSFISDQLRRFRATGRLAVATYGFRKDDLMIKDWGPEKAPWLLNSVIAPHTVRSGPHGVLE